MRSQEKRSRRHLKPNACLRTFRVVISQDLFFKARTACTEYQRTPGENVDPGYKVLIASKATPQGTETLAVYEGRSTFWYSRRSRQWQITRGLVLKDTVKVEEFDKVLKPVGKDKEPGIRIRKAEAVTE